MPKIPTNFYQLTDTGSCQPALASSSPQILSSPIQVTPSRGIDIHILRIIRLTSMILMGIFHVHHLKITA